MRSERPPAPLEHLFLMAVDGTLTPAEQAALETALEADPALRARLTRYRGTVARLRAVPAVRAPAGLEAMVLRRSRRRRSQLRRGGEEGLHLPAEVLVPILLGVLAALLYLGL